MSKFEFDEHSIKVDSDGDLAIEYETYDCYHVIYIDKGRIQELIEWLIAETNFDTRQYSAE